MEDVLGETKKNITVISEGLDNLKDGFNDALDRILGGRKAVCPTCKQITHLIKDTNVLAGHVYIPIGTVIDFRDGIDFSIIKDCPGSNTTILIEEL